MKDKYLIYICDGIGSVFESQVIALINTIKEKDIFKNVYLILGVSNEEQWNKYLNIKQLIKTETVTYKTYPNYPIFNYYIQKGIKQALKSITTEFKKAIFHTRGELTAWHLYKVIGPKYKNNIIPDIRGASIEETKEFISINKALKFLKLLNYKKAVNTLNNFNNISVVSKSLKKYLTDNYKINKDKIAITPCLAGNDFKYENKKNEIIRKQINIRKDDLLVVFSSGGSAKWQNAEILTTIADKGIKVLNLSKQEIIHQNIINKFVNHSEMPLYLNAADAGIIWRDESIVNKTALPVKFVEYVCCGLPVIANNSVDSIIKYLDNNKHGVLIDRISDLSHQIINKLKLINRCEISQKGLEIFNVEKVVDKYLKLYEKIGL